MRLEEGYTKLTLLALAAGVGGERWDHCLAAIVDNIRDTNTDAGAARKITFELILKPQSDREIIAARLDVKTTVSPIASYELPIFVMKDDSGQYYLTLRAPQRDIEEAIAESVLPMAREAR
jgi:hypothetical protein